MEIKEPIHELVIELFGGLPGMNSWITKRTSSESTTDWAGTGQPATVRSLSDRTTASREVVGFPAESHFTTTGRPSRQKIVSPGLAAAQPPDELKRLPSLMSEQ